MRFSTMIRPKWTGSTPIAAIKGSSTGTRMVMAATVSRKQPTISRKTFTRSSTAQRSLVMERTKPATSSVIRVVVTIQPKMLAPATISSTTAVVSMVSMETRRKLCQVRVRYTTAPRNRAQPVPAELGVVVEAAAVRGHGDGAHQGERHQEARDQPGREELADGGVGHHA